MPKRRKDMSLGRFKLLVGLLVLFLCSAIGMTVANGLMAVWPLWAAIIAGFLVTLGIPVIAIAITCWVFGAGTLKSILN